MTRKDSDSIAPTPINFYYFNMTGTQSFCDLLEKWYRKSGHSRPINFIQWNCYRELPGEDADLIAYDGVVLSALADKGFLAPVPKDLSAGDVFPWVIERGRYRLRLYGLPIMMCSNALICRKKDDRNTLNIMELQENTAIPMKSMLMFYYIQALCTNLNVRKSLKVLAHLVDLIGGRDYLAGSSSSEYDGLGRFRREECRYLLSFTETLRDLPKDDYIINFANFSAKETDKRPLFMVDYVSLGKNVPEEKRQDCLDLMKILVDEQFIYEECTLDGQLQYLLTANRQVFRRFAETDPIYAHLLDRLESGNNGVLRYTNRFYDDFYQHGDLLLQFLWEVAGWVPPSWKS